MNLVANILTSGHCMINDGYVGGSFESMKNDNLRVAEKWLAATMKSALLIVGATNFSVTF